MSSANALIVSVGKELTHYRTTNFKLLKLEEFADENLEFDENGRKLSKRVENTVGKTEIARHEQFLLFPQCFQKACFPGMLKGVIVWEWVSSFPINKFWTSRPLFLGFCQ